MLKLYFKLALYWKFKIPHIAQKANSSFLLALMVLHLVSEPVVPYRELGQSTNENSYLWTMLPKQGSPLIGVGASVEMMAG